MIITISGDIGSGKSTVANLVAEKLKYKLYSTGSIFRSIAKEMNISLKELGELSKKTDKYDKQIDNFQKELGEKEDDFVLEGRLGFHFIPHSFKVCLRINVKEAAKCIIKDKRKDETYIDLNEALQHIKNRRKSEKKRYKKLYNVDIENNSQFDLVINTTNLSAIKVRDKIISSLS